MINDSKVAVERKKEALWKDPIDLAELEKENNDEGYLKWVDFVEDLEFTTICKRGKLI